MCGLTAGEQLVDPGVTALVGNGERSQSGVGGNAVRPVQWYGSPITLRRGYGKSIPRGDRPSRYFFACAGLPPDIYTELK